MALWRRDPVDAAFWQDDTTRELLLTIDKCFWPIALINTAIAVTVLRRFFPLWAQLVVGVMLSIILLTTIASAVAIKRDPIGYYMQRGKIMALHRLGRIVCFAVIPLYLDAEKVVKWVNDKVAGGKRPLPFLLTVMTQSVGNHHMWGLYFPLPSHQGICLDLLQQITRLVVLVLYCVRLIEGPALRSTVTSLCTTMNVFLNTDMLPSMATPRAPLKFFDARCVEDGPVLLVLYCWWLWGCFWPTFTVWYCEGALKKSFKRRQQQGVAGEGPGLWTLFRNYLIVIFVVACASWQLLHVLLAHGSNRDWIVRALLNTPWRHLAQSSQ